MTRCVAWIMKQVLTRTHVFQVSSWVTFNLSIESKILYFSNFAVFRTPYASVHVLFC